MIIIMSGSRRTSAEEPRGTWVNLLTPLNVSLWKLYLEKFEDPVVRVLLVAALFSLIISVVEWCQGL